MKIQFRWLVALLVLNLWLTPNARSQKAYDMGRMGGSSMSDKFPFEGAFFSTESVADKALPSHATQRIVKFAFRSKLGWYAIAYYPEHQPKAGMKEYGRFTVASADKDKNLYVITLYNPDYKDVYKAVVPNPAQPNDLSGKKQVATIELKVEGNELAVTVKKADSDQISFASGDTFRMTAGPPARQRNSICFNDPNNAFGDRTPIIRKVLESTLRRTMTLLPITDVTITVRPDPAATIPGYGVGGYTPNAHTVNIALDPKFTDWERLIANNLPQTLAHELHHAARWRGPGYGSTLFQAMISEGLADRFAVELLGVPVTPWSDAFPKEQTARLMAMAQPKFDVEPYGSDDHARWFFGSDASIPMWTGYTLGYRLVEDYIAHHPGATAATLVQTPADAFRPTAPTKQQEQSATGRK